MTSAYVPALQSVQADVPAADAKVPVLQNKHALKAVEPVALTARPIGQLVQLDKPVLGPYLPAEHSVQSVEPVLAAKCPKEHATQVDTELAPTTDDAVPILQLLQAVMLVLPVLAEYLPAGQLVQAVMPVRSAYVPAARAIPYRKWKYEI